MILKTPLDWPDDVPMRSPKDQKPGSFMQNGLRITIAQAVKRLDAELGRLGAINGELSAMFSTNRSSILSIVPAREEQGVVLRFNIDQTLYTLPMDRYEQAAQNIAGLAAHIDATRAIDRHGVATSQQALQAFAALPPRSTVLEDRASQPARPKRHWWLVLGVQEHADLEIAEAAFRTLVRKHHPDVGGDHANFVEIQTAIAEARDARE